jgi:hypothetical protein
LELSPSSLSIKLLEIKLLSSSGEIAIFRKVDRLKEPNLTIHMPEINYAEL